MKIPAAHPAYPSASVDRSRWIISQRGPKNSVDSRRPYAFFLEQERSRGGEVLPTATLFLANRECPWRCLMCDLWRNTTDERVPAGAIPDQIRFALDQLPPARQIKLYNSGSFFDPNAIPPEDIPAIARLVRKFESVIVECHPRLVNDRCLDFADQLDGQLEVAMGLETVHERALDQLNKGMTLRDFELAGGKLRAMEIAVRAFILVQPPFVPMGESLFWTQRSVDFANGTGAGAIALIPTRLGNGALDELARQGQFSEPELGLLESALEYGIDSQKARVFADLWDLRRFSRCQACFEARQARLHRMNLDQQVLPPIVCPQCRASTSL